MESENLTSELTTEDRILLLFDYLGPLALVSLVASRRELVKWHAKQGLLLTTAYTALFVVWKAVYLLVQNWPLLSFFTELAWILFSLGTLGAWVVVLICIVRSQEGERFKVPVLGDLADRL